MAENKIPEDTRKKISEAMQKSWVKRKRKSASSGTPSGPKADILNTIDQTTQTFKKLTLEEITGLAKTKGAEAKITELSDLVSDLKHVVKSRSSSISQKG